LQSRSQGIEFTEAGRRTVSNTNTINNPFGLVAGETEGVAGLEPGRIGAFVASTPVTVSGSIGVPPTASSDSVLGGAGDRQAVE
jgi:hypothetical protein